MSSTHRLNICRKKYSVTVHVLVAEMGKSLDSEMLLLNHSACYAIFQIVITVMFFVQSTKRFPC